MWRARRRWFVTAALCAGLAVASIGGNSDAQTVAEPAEVVSRTPTGEPWTGDNRQSSISANGRIVEFGARPEGDQVSVRDRPGNTTVFVPLAPSVHGSVSDDGCVIAYTYGVPVVFGSGSVYTILAFDRCTGANLTVGSAVGPPGGNAPRPVPNQDGSVIVWSTGLALQRATRSGSTYTMAAPISFGDARLGPNVAVSDDGNLIAFETIEPAPEVIGVVAFIASSAVFLVDVSSPATPEPISVGDDGSVLSRASDPSISGDGTLVTYSLRVSDTVSAVVLRDRTNGVNRSIAAPATSAEVSRDGRYVTYLLRGGEIGDVYVARSTSPQRFASFVTDLVSYVDGDPATTTGGSAQNPAISAFGRWVSFESYAADLLVPGTGFERGTHVYVRQREPVLTVQSIDFGSASGPIDRPSVVQNVGPSGWRVTSITASGPFSVVGENCPAVLHPGASCTVTVRYTPSGSGTQTGELVVRDDSYPGVPLAASGRLIGVSDPALPPPPSTTTTLPAVPGLDITPDPVTFDASVVGVAASDRSATVTNTGDTAITISSVALSGAASGDFSITSDACTDVTLASGSSCPLELGFAPSAAGTRLATVTATGSGSTSASAELQGSGRFDAVLRVSPEVGRGGQVVMILGTGYPASTSIGITVAGNPPVPVTTDGAGDFMLPWLVLSGVPQGEVTVDDVAVAGVYDADAVPLQIVGSPMRPQGTATLSPSSRRHVSR